MEAVQEAPLLEADGGLVPEGDGWFVVNVAEARGSRSPRFGASVRFEGEARFPEFAINVRVLEPGQPNGLYHREAAQEAALVLSGECLALVEGEERSLRKGDFIHWPARTAHILIGAGDAPCSVLMVGTRKSRENLFYAADEVAARHGAAAEEDTPDENVAYAGSPPIEPHSLGLPW
jgi:uncharacterized cupin superfamily protein